MIQPKLERRAVIESRGNGKSAIRAAFGCDGGESVVVEMRGESRRDIHAARVEIDSSGGLLKGTISAGAMLVNPKGDQAMPDPRKPNPDDMPNPLPPPVPGREPMPIDEPEPDRLPDET